MKLVCVNNTVAVFHHIIIYAFHFHWTIFIGPFSLDHFHWIIFIGSFSLDHFHWTIFIGQFWTIWNYDLSLKVVFLFQIYCLKNKHYTYPRLDPAKPNLRSEWVPRQRWRSGQLRRRDGRIQLRSAYAISSLGIREG